MYTSEIDHPDRLVSAMLQLHLEPLFYKYKIGINLFAHLHAYERSCPIYQQKCIDDGITNVLIGMSGIALDSRSYSTTDWSQYHNQQYLLIKHIYISDIIIIVIIILLINLYFRNRQIILFFSSIHLINIF
jgi:hypothetical protein